MARNSSWKSGVWSVLKPSNRKEEKRKEILFQVSGSLAEEAGVLAGPRSKNCVKTRWAQAGETQVIRHYEGQGENLADRTRSRPLTSLWAVFSCAHLFLQQRHWSDAKLGPGWGSQHSDGCQTQMYTGSELAAVTEFKKVSVAGNVHRHVVGWEMASHRCPPPNAWSLWICYLTFRKDSPDVIKVMDIEMTKLSQISWWAPCNHTCPPKSEAGKSGSDNIGQQKK